VYINNQLSPQFTIVALEQVSGNHNSFYRTQLALPTNLASIVTIAQERVWLITGANSGFGKEFVHQVLARGDTVIATGRNTAKLAAALGNTDAHLLTLDVTDPLEDLRTIAAQATKIYGRICSRQKYRLHRVGHD